MSWQISQYNIYYKIMFYTPTNPLTIDFSFKFICPFLHNNQAFLFSIFANNQNGQKDHMTKILYVSHHLNVCHYTTYLSSELWLFNGPIVVAAFSRDWLHLETKSWEKYLSSSLLTRQSCKRRWKSRLFRGSCLSPWRQFLHWIGSMPSVSTSGSFSPLPLSSFSY